MLILRIRIETTSVHYLRSVTKIFFLTTILISLGFTSLPQKTATPEYQVKAVFLYNIAQFVEWPKDSIPEDTSSIIIGLLGKDPFGSYIDDTIKGEEVNGHPLIIERYAAASDIKNCHILFIHSALGPKLNSILKNLRGKNILTVSDATNFTKLGGMVGFITQENKIRIQINLEDVKEENITISSKLLRLAEIVGPQ
jgi:hypothetical protein